jgi:hypothetical protein
MQQSDSLGISVHPCPICEPKINLPAQLQSHSRLAILIEQSTDSSLGLGPRPKKSQPLCKKRIILLLNGPRFARVDDVPLSTRVRKQGVVGSKTR